MLSSAADSVLSDKYVFSYPGFRNMLIDGTIFRSYINIVGRKEKDTISWRRKQWKHQEEETSYSPRPNMPDTWKPSKSTPSTRWQRTSMPEKDGLDPMNNPFDMERWVKDWFCRQQKNPLPDSSPQGVFLSICSGKLSMKSKPKQQ